MPQLVASLQEQVQTLRLQREAAALRSSLRAHDLLSRRVIREGWGDMVDPTEYLRDGAGMSYFGDLSHAPQISRPEDRLNGDNVPFWNAESQIATIRGICRHIAATDETAIGVLESLTNYVVGVGFGYEASPVDESGPARQAAAWVQSIIDSVNECNGWEGELERELFQRSHRDGEIFVGLHHRGGSRVELRIVDPSFVTEPADKRRLEDYLGIGHGLDWKYGVAAQPHNPAAVLGYFVSWYGQASDWDFYSPATMVHLKLNVDREVKRGLSDFFAVYQNLERAERLLGNTLEGAAVQAAIAYIREHADGTTRTDIEDLITEAADSYVDTPRRSGGTTRRQIRYRPPGTVEDVTAGYKYHAGPLGDSRRGSAYLDVVQGAMRKVGVRWSLPEYMISGDASNGNFSSTLVAESPMTKAAEAKQMVYVRAYREVMWKAAALVASKTGRDIRQIKRLVEINVDPPAIAVRDRLQDHTIRQEEHAAGILSLETWAAEAGRDLVSEQSRGARPLPTPIAASIPESIIPAYQRWAGYP